MTPERRIKLRKWSAELMGWIKVEASPNLKAYYLIPTPNPDLGVIHKFGPFVEDWTPDLPSAPASQILGVIERMRELGWILNALYESIDTPSTWTAQFYFIENGKGTRDAFAESDTLPEAILEAGFATGVGL